MCGFQRVSRINPARDWNPVEITVTVADENGYSDGMFLSEDTLLYDQVD